VNSTPLIRPLTLVLAGIHQLGSPLRLVEDASAPFLSTYLKPFLGLWASVVVAFDSFFCLEISVWVGIAL
jgi:hypothetical protein